MEALTGEAPLNPEIRVKAGLDYLTIQATPSHSSGSDYNFVLEVRCLNTLSNEQLKFGLWLKSEQRML